MNLVLLQSCPSAAPNAVHYQVQVTEDPYTCVLEATNGGKTRELFSTDGDVLSIEAVRDFDGNGTPDVLVGRSSGGTSAYGEYFFVSAGKDGNFTLTEEFGYSPDGPTIERWKGEWTVVVTSDNEGWNQDRPHEVTQRFALRAGEAVLLSSVERKELPALGDLRSEVFDFEQPDSPRSIEFDLDEDGRPDVISGTLWQRWGRIVWDVRFADGKAFRADTACKRVGVLASKTKGVRDLVCDFDSTYRWDGSAYVEQPEP
ncbi:MAG: hypothetical protein QM765_34575 [Myxococcales bacterium]